MQVKLLFVKFLDGSVSKSEPIFGFPHNRTPNFWPKKSVYQQSPKINKN